MSRGAHEVDFRNWSRLAAAFSTMHAIGTTGRSVAQWSAELICVDPESVHQLWPLAEPLLRRAIERTGLTAFCEVERDILCGDALLWLAVEGEGTKIGILAAASTRLQQTDSGKVCVITACAGTDMPRWLNLIGRVEEFASNEGCTCVRIYGRKGWLRALDGYEQTHVILDKELANGRSP